jgi:hypothetical protein
MNNSTCSFASPKIEPRAATAKGRAVFCVNPIQKDEVVAILGGELLSLAVALSLTDDDKSQCLQIEEDHVLWISSFTQSTADWINHSCDPNLGLSGQITLIALRDIAVGEEVCYDYAMSDGSNIDEFSCQCGAPACRRSVSGRDWMNPALQKAYVGHFSPYLTRRIVKLKTSANGR